MTDKIANPERGEVAISLGGHAFVMRPTYQAIVEMEQMAGAGVVTLTRRIASGQYGLRDIAAIVTAGLRGAGETKATLDAVGEMVLADGVASHVDAVNQFLINAITGGKKPGTDSPGEAKAAAGQT